MPHTGPLFAAGGSNSNPVVGIWAPTFPQPDGAQSVPGLHFLTSAATIPFHLSCICCCGCCCSVEMFLRMQLFLLLTVHYKNIFFANIFILKRKN
jgi:hypothetical protein